MMSASIEFLLCARELVRGCSRLLLKTVPRGREHRRPGRAVVHWQSCIETQATCLLSIPQDLKEEMAAVTCLICD